MLQRRRRHLLPGLLLAIPDEAIRGDPVRHRRSVAILATSRLRLRSTNCVSLTHDGTCQGPTLGAAPSYLPDVAC